MLNDLQKKIIKSEFNNFLKEMKEKKISINYKSVILECITSNNKYNDNKAEFNRLKILSAVDRARAILNHSDPVLLFNQLSDRPNIPENAANLKKDLFEFMIQIIGSEHKKLFEMLEEISEEVEKVKEGLVPPAQVPNSDMSNNNNAPPAQDPNSDMSNINNQQQMDKKKDKLSIGTILGNYDSKDGMFRLICNIDKKTGEEAKEDRTYRNKNLLIAAGGTVVLGISVYMLLISGGTAAVALGPLFEGGTLALKLGMEGKAVAAALIAAAEHFGISLGSAGLGKAGLDTWIGRTGSYKDPIAKLEKAIGTSESVLGSGLAELYNEKLFELCNHNCSSLAYDDRSSRSDQNKTDRLGLASKIQSLLDKQEIDWPNQRSHEDVRNAIVNFTNIIKDLETLRINKKIVLGNLSILTTNDDRNIREEFVKLSPEKQNTFICGLVDTFCVYLTMTKLSLELGSKINDVSMTKNAQCRVI